MGNFLSVLQSIPCRGYKAMLRWTKWYVSVFFVLFRKRDLRMFQYDLTANGQPYKTGFFIPCEEWNLECYSKKQEKDDMFCFGINSYGDCLVVQISRDCACDSSSSLLLKIKGHTYILPVKFECLTANDERTFGTNRFYMQCIAPLRKWKIFFNGMLREIDSGKRNKDVHVRFSLLWVASSGVFDYLSDYSSTNMADILSDIRWNSMKPPINKILSNLNQYHQPGMIHGVIEIKSESVQELTLWGCRYHSFSAQKDFDNLEIFGNTENGFFLSFKVLSPEKHLSVRNITGYVMQPNGLLKSVRFLSARRIFSNSKTVLSFRIKAGDLFYNVSIFFYGHGRLLNQRLSNNTTLSIIDIIVNEIWGSGIVIDRKNTKGSRSHEKCKQILNLIKISKHTVEPLTVKLEESSCLNKSLTGNLGSTLAKLMQLKDIISGYDVPDTIVVTSSGYKEFMSLVHQSVQNLKEKIYKCDRNELLIQCEKVVDEISDSPLPTNLFESLIDKLSNMLIDDKDISFNVYPSATGADVEVLLLEKYLNTYFNIKGLSDVIKCIKRCWASQYSFHAVLCKKSTGLPLSTPMAVVIQKVVSFSTFGIISTCESATGNPSILEIREVVSSNTTCITRLKRDLYQHIKILDTIILLDDDNDAYKNNKAGNTKNATLADEEDTLSSEQAVFLGKLACKLEVCFNFPLEIEWFFAENSFFIIQVRTITFINAMPKSEVFHYYDTYIRSEDDWFSSFASGEAFLGPISPLGMNFINFSIDVLIARLKYLTSDQWNIQMPYFPKFLIYSHYHMMYSIADGLLRFHSLSDTVFFQSASFIMNFKPSAGEALLEFLSFKYGSSNLSFKSVLKNVLALFTPLRQSKYFEAKICCYNLESLDTASDILDVLSKNYQDFTEPFIHFMKCTYRALLWTMLIFYVLKKSRKKAGKLQMDFNFLMSACSVPEDGDMAVDMLALCRRISLVINPLLFKMMPVEDAKVWLEDAEIDKRVQFSDFLRRHGHRCSNEVDLFKKCWSMDPIHLIRVLQMVLPNSLSDLVHVTFPLDSIFSQLSVMPNSVHKAILRCVVPKCYSALREAKRAKSDLLRVVAFWRQALHILAQKAVEEFRIPFPEVLFFLSLDEIKQILKTEMPHLVTKALKCWEIFADLEKNSFPVIAIGYPLPLDENYFNGKRLPAGSCLQGCPMSRGTVVGNAVVIKNFCEVTDVEKGSILITRSPSIVWSLYFPVLGGFAADMGGVLSDGAVAARDWGLPCVINLVRASQVLRTGDRIFLDSNSGILRRMKNLDS